MRRRARARAMLDERCGDDLDLRREVESLLALARAARGRRPSGAARSHPRPPGPERRSPDGRDAGSGNTRSSSSSDAGGMGDRLQGARRAARTSRRVEVPAAALQRTRRARKRASSSRRARRPRSTIRTSARFSRSARPTTDSCSSRCRSTTAKRCRRDWSAAGCRSRGTAHRASDRARARPRARARHRASRHQAVQHHACCPTAP